jgi:hypothetical protein
VRRAAPWLALFAVYALTIFIPATSAHDLSRAEGHQLLVARSLLDDGDVDLRNQYRKHADRDLHAGRLTPWGVDDAKRGRIEPQGFAFALLVAPALAVGGTTGVQLFLAAIATLAFGLGSAFARRLVPEPWATGGPLLVALSPPALAMATTVTPDMTAAAAITLGAVLALRVRERPRVRTGIFAAAPVAAAPWLGIAYLAPAAVVIAAAARWLRRRSRAVQALVTVEVGLGSLVVLGSVSRAFYGGLTPVAAAGPDGLGVDADVPRDLAGRIGRLVTLWVGEGGLLVWAPITVLGLAVVWLVLHERRERLARAVPDYANIEVAALLALSVVTAAWLTAVLAAPHTEPALFGGRPLAVALPALGALTAWGVRRWPRTGRGLGVLTLVLSVVVVASLAIDGSGWLDGPLGPSG